MRGGAGLSVEQAWRLLVLLLLCEREEVLKTPLGFWSGPWATTPVVPVSIGLWVTRTQEGGVNGDSLLIWRGGC